MTKQCNKCKKIKELNEFKKKLNQYSHIFIDICKECKIISQKAKRSIIWNNYYKKNKSILNKNTNQWKKDNPEKTRIHKQRERLKNKDKYHERWKKSYYKDIEKSRKKTNQYRKDNIKKIQEIDRIRGAKNRDNLTDQYVKETLVKRTNLKTSDISDELVKTGRKYIQARREHFKVIKATKDE